MMRIEKALTRKLFVRGATSEHKTAINLVGIKDLYSIIDTSQFNLDCHLSLLS